MEKVRDGNSTLSIEGKTACFQKWTKRKEEEEEWKMEQKSVTLRPPPPPH